MSVILQPFQGLPFYMSLDSQLRYLEGCDNCAYENVIQQGEFIPFAILAPDETVGLISLYNCSNEFEEYLNLAITSIYNEETGLWFHYYNGDDIVLGCGSYYLTVVIGDLIYYSELFTIKPIRSEILFFNDFSEWEPSGYGYDEPVGMNIFMSSNAFSNDSNRLRFNFTYPSHYGWSDNIPHGKLTLYRKWTFVIDEVVNGHIIINKSGTIIYLNTVDIHEILLAPGEDIIWVPDADYDTPANGHLILSSITVEEIKLKYPELIYDEYHLPLRIYDNITKQLANKCDVDCDVSPLNPVSTILPFFFKTEEDINSLQVLLVDVCTGEEIDLTADLELEFIKKNPGGTEIVDTVTSMQPLRNSVYQWDWRNYVFQEIRINDAGILKSITFEIFFYNEYHAYDVYLIKGTNPAAIPINVYNIYDTAIISKEITIDYESLNIPVIQGETYIIKIIGSLCFCNVGIYSSKIYPDGRFGFNNTLGLLLNELQYLSGGNRNFTSVNPLVAPIMSDTIGYECYEESIQPTGSNLFCLKITSNNKKYVTLSTYNFICNSHAGEHPFFEIYLNATQLLTWNYNVGSTQSVHVPPFAATFVMDVGDFIEIRAYANTLGTAYWSNGATILFQKYHSDTSITTPQPTGVTYLNQSLWFYCNVLKTITTSGTGDTLVYNPGRPLPSPLTCGNYYLKMINGANKWFSEWFRVINVGFIELTRYALGTEDDEFIITEDDELIEI